MCKIKTEDVYKDFSKDNEIIDFSNCCVKSKFYNSDALVVGKMVDATAGLPIKDLLD